MAFAAKVRTTPTVKPLATMNKRNMQTWELRLGMFQVVIVAGVLTGSMACAFGIGYVSGQRVGFENASSASLSKLPKYPIAVENVKELSDQDVSEVYAKLQTDKSEKNKVGQATEKELPKIGAIESAEVAPVVDDLVVDLLNEEESDKVGSKKAKNEDSVAIRILGDSEADGIKKDSTLGSLITRKEEASEATTNIAEEVNLKPQPAQEKSEIAGIVEKSPGFYIQEKEPKSEDHKIKIRPDKEVELANNELTASKADLKNNPEKLELSKKETVEVEPGSIYLRNQIQVGWYSQIAAPQSLQDANGLAGKLHSSGFPVAIERAQVRGQVYYRVLVGPEEDRVKGERLLGQVKRESYLVGQPFLRLIK